MSESSLPDKTKQIGILGGMGPIATSDCFERLLTADQTSQNAIQDGDYPDVTIESVSFDGSNEDGIVNGGSIQQQCFDATVTCMR